MKNSNVKDEILLYLEQEERPLAWLSRKTEIPYPTLYSIFIQRIMNLSDTNLAKIINLIKPQNNFKKKLKIFGDIKNKTIFVPQ